MIFTPLHTMISSRSGRMRWTAPSDITWRGCLPVFDLPLQGQRTISPSNVDLYRSTT